MKAIFLDFDGVINDYGEDTDPRLLLRSEKVVMIDDIILACNDPVHLVISSTWRMSQPLDSFKFWLRRLGCWHWKEMSFTKRITSSFGQPPIAVVDGKTYTSFRGVEIDEWLGRHPEITGYVILDDDGDFFEHQKPFHVCTDNHIGLTIFDKVKAIEVLNSGGLKP